MRRAEDVGLIDEDFYKWSFYTKLDGIDRPIHMKGVFEHLKTQKNGNDSFLKAMEGANFEITKESLLDAAIDLINDIYKEADKEREQGQHFQDTLGDFYELILNQTGEAGKNGQFRTPRHIIQFMCELLKPTLEDTICDVTAGTSGFLVGAYQYIIKNNSDEKPQIDENGFEKRTSGNLIEIGSKEEEKLTKNTFFGYDIDATMIRLGMMNLIMHNIKEPHIKRLDTISQKFDDLEKDVKYSKILANPPFTGKIDSLQTSLLLNRVYEPKFNNEGKRLKQNIQSELLFLERIVQLLKINGKAAVIVPEGVLFGKNNAYKKTREILLKDCNLEAIISLPNGVFKPYAGVKTSILVFTKKSNNSKVKWHTKKVWFYELEGDGYSLDDNRKKLKENPLPEAVKIFESKNSIIKEDRKKHFYVSLDEIQKSDLDLSYDYYRDFEYVEKNYDPPKDILKALFLLEEEISVEMEELKNLIE
ncbi:MULTISPECIES: HsdM family class I SAM-dependent methyltransferase [Flavobacteriaceae]|uniref:site-specific DNA-methyltransferase (adenine-specific) n=1 Tax=Lutibacter litoralis TaxID=321268 RepID=A0ABV5JW92_9FLAO|nr:MULTISPECIES: N-6 DNA methylase [Flavobacteriaceae]GGK37898.1 DNA methyltransferase [Lutibacter litoralis]